MLYYKTDKNQFSDGASIEWYIWMSPKETYIWKNKIKQNITEYMKLPIFSNKTSKDNYVLHLPIDRMGKMTESININKSKSTVKDVITAIYNFYNKNITKTKMSTIYSKYDEYFANLAKNKFAKGLTVKRYEVLGASGFTGSKRNPFWCKGLVRYEGVKRRGKTNEYFLLLGS